MICGMDEVGRGPLAGPVVASAVVLPPDFPVEILADSKKLSEKKRREERGLCKPRGREYSEITAVSGADRVKLQRGQWRDSHDRSTWNR